MERIQLRRDSAAAWSVIIESFAFFCLSSIALILSLIPRNAAVKVSILFEFSSNSASSLSTTSLIAGKSC
jgi:hypothetical protein